jgi:hypothetical protein
MSSETTVKIKIEGVEYPVDVNGLTIGEVEMLERETGKPLGQIDFDSITAVAVLGWIARKRKEPMFTIDDMRRIPLSQIEAVQDEDPTQAVEDGAGITEDTSGSLGWPTDSVSSPGNSNS